MWNALIRWSLENRVAVLGAAPAVGGSHAVLSEEVAGVHLVAVVLLLLQGVAFRVPRVVEVMELENPVEDGLDVLVGCARQDRRVVMSDAAVEPRLVGPEHALIREGRAVGIEFGAPR